MNNTRMFECQGYVIVERCEDGASQYRGVDRSPWDVVLSKYWSGDLPPSVKIHFEEMRSRDLRGVWWPFARTVSSLETLFRYTSACGGDVSVVAVASRYLAAIGIPTVRLPAGEQLGYDIVSPGEWSLLRVLCEEAPEAIGRNGLLLNSNGLLDCPASADAIVSLYHELAADGLVEEIGADPRLPVDVVGVAMADITNFR